jgi:hypothetical protein
MAAIAKHALVLLTALPMLATPGWCCVAWTAPCKADASGTADLTGEKASATPVSHVPACCAKRAKSRSEAARVANSGTDAEANGCAGVVEAAACDCCYETRSVAVAPVVKQILPATPAVAWMAALPLERSAVAAPALAHGPLESPGPSLQSLQCVWRC